MSQSENKAYITQPAPAFTCTALLPDLSFGPISLSDYKEIIEFSDRIEEFKAIDCEVIAASVDSQYSHLAWVQQTRKQGGLGGVHFPLLADTKHTLSKDFGVYLPEAGHALRGLFIIDTQGVIRHATLNDPTVGRNVSEVLRLVQAFKFVDMHGEVCPSGWTPGQKTINPHNKEAYFSEKQ